MPNHVKNIIKLTGPQNEIDYIVNLITKTEEIDGETQKVVDFNSLIPMPKTLNVVSGGCSDECLLVYLRHTFDTETAKIKNEHLKIIKDYNLRQVWRYKGVDLDKMPSSEELYGKIQKLINMYGPEAKNPFGDNPVFTKEEDVINYGKQIYGNIRDYGCKDWYDWSIEHWGTKWNSYGNEQDVMPNCTKLKFETAWDIPFNFYVKLYEVIHRDCKSLSCNIRYANEDYGSGLGEIADINGDKVMALNYLYEYENDWDTLEEIAGEIWGE